jgi:hypothetical protein
MLWRLITNAIWFVGESCRGQGSPARSRCARLAGAAPQNARDRVRCPKITGGNFGHLSNWPMKTKGPAEPDVAIKTYSYVFFNKNGLLSRYGARVAQRTADSKTRVFKNDGSLNSKIVFLAVARPWSGQAYWHPTTYAGTTVNARAAKFLLNRRQQRERRHQVSVSSVTSCSNARPEF